MQLQNVSKTDPTANVDFFEDFFELERRTLA